MNLYAAAQTSSTLHAMQPEHLWARRGVIGQQVENSTNIWQRGKLEPLPRSIKLPPTTASLGRSVKVGLKCGTAGVSVTRECGISRNHAPGIIMQRGALHPTSCSRLWNISNLELSLQICSLSTSPRLPCQI